MIGFGLITEGITDQTVIRQILHGFFNDRARNRIKKATQNYTFRELRISTSKKMTEK
jgi:hypothetical protein